MLKENTYGKGVKIYAFCVIMCIYTYKYLKNKITSKRAQTRILLLRFKIMFVTICNQEIPLHLFVSHNRIHKFQINF